MRLRTDQTRKMMSFQPTDQSIDDYLPLNRIVGLCNLSQEQKPSVPVGCSIAKNYRKKSYELASGIVPVRLILGESQTQQQVSPCIETVGMECDLLQGPHEMAPNIASNHPQIGKVLKRSVDLFGYEGGINLGQGR